MMRKLLMCVMFAASAGGFTALPAAPAAAQTQDRIIDVYGDEKCPASNGQQIVVCRRHSKDEQFRIPKDLRDQEPAPQARGGNVGAVAAVNSTGGTGTMQVNSCNAIGAGVNAGCDKQRNANWKAEKDAEKKAEQDIP
jgi:hypothetical protein